MAQDGVLSLYGGLESIRFSRDHDCFDLKFDDQTRRCADILVDCTGAGHDIRRTQNVLLRRLQTAGMIRPCSTGGIQLTHSLRVPGEYIYVAGHLAHSVQYLTSGLGFCRTMLKKIVAELDINCALSGRGRAHL